MIKLVIMNVIIIALSFGVLYIVKKNVKNEKYIKIIFIILPILTILCHYSSLLYHKIVDGSAMGFLVSNPNLILPIYPCNVVMWCLLIYAFNQKKESKFSYFLRDYGFFFGIISALVGMFANVDFIKNPNLFEYDIFKGVLAHGFMLLNILALPFFNRIKIDLPRNMLHILISIVMMLLIGLYCNLVIKVLSGSDYEYQVNSMFLIHSPFDGVNFLTYPFIAGIAIVAYFAIFNICELFAYKKGERWFNRIKNIKFKNNN